MTVIKDGQKTFEADTLLDCIPFLKGKVRMVSMMWTWNQFIELNCPDRWPFTHEGEIRARYLGERIDDEYSYVGSFDPEAFAEFARGYSCWDGEELTILDGVLVGYYEGYDPDAAEFPDSDESIDVMDYYNLCLVEYQYWDEDAKKWRDMP